MKKILFVCSGNTCRSPLAERIAKELLADTSIGKADISSAGSSAFDGVPASTLAVKVAEKHSIDLSDHRSRLLNRTMVREADLIIAMTEKHRGTVGVIEPSALDYTVLITDLCDDAVGDVPDPIGLSIDEYERTYQIIRKCLSQFRDNIDSFDGWKSDA